MFPETAILQIENQVLEGFINQAKIMALPDRYCTVPTELTMHIGH